MAKKWIAVMLVVCIGLAGGVVYLRTESDHKGPEIVCSDQAVTEYDPSMSDADLTQGITASDDVDGDVTDTLTVESVYEVDDSHVVVTYVAKDKSNNITKFKRNLEADPEKMRDSGVVKRGTKSDAETETDAEPTQVPVEDVETGDFEFGSTDLSLTPTPELTPASDDPAALAEQEQEAKADAMPSTSPKIYLTDYYVTTSVGSSVDLLSYVKDIQDDTDETSELWKRIQITGQVNTAVAGTYTCNYYVVDTAGNMSNSAELTVVVE